MFEVLKISPTYAVKYAHPDATDLALRNHPLRPSYNYHRGTISRKSRQRITNSLNWMILFSPMQKTYCRIEKRFITFRINFITLTLSAAQMHTDQFIKEHMLAPFLKWMERQGAKQYVWKAETQNNGNIHFHITANQYLHWRIIRTKWNELQENHRYIEAYIGNGGSGDPNSTDVHAVKKDHQLVGYMLKYMAKVETWCHSKGRQKIYKSITDHFFSLGENQNFPVPKRPVEGRLWAVSNALANINCFITEKEPNYRDNRNTFLDIQAKRERYKFVSGEFFELYMYPHLISSSAPVEIAAKIKRLRDDCINKASDN